jgi:hypothetical protein
MSTDQLTGKRKALVVGVALTLLAAVIITGLVLREYGPGNMWAGFLVGAGVAILAAGVAAWRVARRPGRATTFERAWTQTGDERDDTVLTKALAVLGLLVVPLTGIASIAIALGGAAEVVLTVLLVVEVLVGAAAFAVVNRRN